MGYLEIGPEFWPLNFVLLITLYYIFRKAKDSAHLNIYPLQTFIKRVFLEQESLSILNNSNVALSKKWVLWRNNFNAV